MAYDDYEIWHSTDYPEYDDENCEPLPDGWYYWWCLPGCLPDSEPFGPFDSYDDAEAAVIDEIEEIEAMR